MSRYEDTPTQNSNTLFPFARHYSGVNEADSAIAFSNTILGESLEGIFHNWRDSANTFLIHNQKAWNWPSYVTYRNRVVLIHSSSKFLKYNPTSDN